MKASKCIKSRKVEATSYIHSKNGEKSGIKSKVQKILQENL